MKKINLLILFIFSLLLCSCESKPVVVVTLGDVFGIGMFLLIVLCFVIYFVYLWISTYRKKRKLKKKKQFDEITKR